MKALAAILCLAFSGCAPRAIVVEPITPAAQHAHDTAKAASKASVAATVAAKDASLSGTMLGFAIAKAVVLADKQRGDPSIPKEVSEQTFATLTNIAALAVELERRQKKVEVATSEAADRSADTESETAALVPKAKKADQTVVTLTTENEKLKPDAMLGKGFRWTIYITIGLILVGAFLLFTAKGGILLAKLSSPFK